jgi:anti-sigma factor RsiW
VADLTALGFMLLGGRLDYIDGKPVAAVVYRRRVHVINLFCALAPGTAKRGAVMKSLQGFNVRRWIENGLNLWAVSDIGADELTEFGEKFEAAVRQ